MDLALITARQVLILFFMILAGFVCGKTGAIKPEGKKTLSELLLYLILPAMILDSYLIRFDAATFENLLIAFGLSAALMLGGGVIIQRFGDLIRGRRSTPERMEGAFITPTLNATPGDLSLVLPKRILDDIVEMIYALDKIAPGTANEDTLLYGVEVKFYNMEVEVNKKLESNQHPGLYIIGDGSGITHSLSHASASGVYVARNILE